MNDSQRNLLFWLLLLTTPVVWLYTSQEAGLPAGILVAIACVGAAFYVRAGRTKP